MFPTQKASSPNDRSTGSNGENVGTSFYFDFDEGDFILKDGNATKLEKIEAIKMWVKKIIKTDRYVYEIYDNYGISLKDLITGDYPQGYVNSEIERILTTALSAHSQIISVYNFNFTRERRTLKVNFNIDTVYGTINEVVTI